ncbi:MAG: alpha-ketoacid dehydrogenase subunit beta [Bdellovibrionales bacterium]
MRVISFAEALREGTDQLLTADSSVYLIGEGVPDPKCIFGTTAKLKEKHPNRVFDMPIAENGLTGVAIGSSLNGMKPIMVHQRMDFTLYAMDQIINNAAKWYSMFGGQKSVPMVVRMIIGRGWGQGNQHSQNLEALYAHIPGLKVVMPGSAYAAKGMLIAAVKDPNPVIFIEHRWLHNTTSDVPEEMYEVPIGKARVAREGKDLTIVTWGYMTLEVMKACEYLEKQGLSPEVLDMQTLRPMDLASVKKSVKKTGRLLVATDAWRFGSLASEVITTVVEDFEIDLKSKPQRLTYPDFPSPSTHGLTKFYYNGPTEVVEAVGRVMGKDYDTTEVLAYQTKRTHDVPDQNFKGPF